MKTKRIISLLLVALVLLGVFAGCSIQEQDKLDSDNNAASNNNTEGRVETDKGDLLDAPEKAVSVGDRLYINCTIAGDDEETVDGMEIAVDQITDDTYVLYASNGMLKLNEVVYEVSDNQIVKYYKDSLMEGFVMDTEPGQDTLRSEVDGFLEILSYFLMSHPDYDGMKYKKTEAYSVTLGVKGEVYGYDMYSDGQMEGTIYIDGTTGLMLRLADADGNTVYSVIEFKTEDLEIPQYK